MTDHKTPLSERADEFVLQFDSADRFETYNVVLAKERWDELKDEIRTLEGGLRKILSLAVELSYFHELIDTDTRRAKKRSYEIGAKLDDIARNLIGGE